jgi:O-antigen/teichoic acid export membrane protein
MEDLYEQPLSWCVGQSRFQRVKLFPLEEELAAQATLHAASPAGTRQQQGGPTGAADHPGRQQPPGARDPGPGYDDLSTIPVAVLRNISERQASAHPPMSADISQAAGSAAYVSAGNIGGSVLKYGSNLLIQRTFGAAAFGLYTLAMSVVTLVTALFNLGLDDAMVRFVSIYRARRKIASLRGLVIFCTALVGLSGILGAVFMVLTAPSLAAVKHSPELAPILVMMSAMVPLSCMQTIWLSGLQGFKDFKWRVLLQRVLMPVVLIVLLIGAIMFSRNVYAVIEATLIYGLIGAVLSFVFFFLKLIHLRQSGPDEYELRTWFGFAAPNFLTSIVDTGLESIDTLLLAFFAVSNVALGQYAAAIKLSSFIAMPQASFNSMFAPTIAELHSQGERQKLAAMFQIVTKWSITFSLPIFWIVTLFSVPLLSISGPQFIPAWPLVIAFAVGTMINVGTGSAGYILLMTGHTRTSFLNSLTAIIVNIAAGVVLTPRYGAMGVAIATGLAIAVVNLMRLLQVWVLVKMQPYRWDVLKPVVAGLISALLTGALLYLLGLAHVSVQISRFHLSLQLSLVPVFLVSYTGLLVLFQITPEDRIVLDMLRRKLRRGKKNTKKNKR